VRATLPGRDTPVTAVVVVALLLVTVAVRPGGVFDLDVARWASTNLVNLNRHPISAMLASIFVVPNAVSAEVLAVPFVGAFAERRIGPARLVIVALVGHVVATLASEGAVRLAIDSGTDDRSAAWQLDVGVSYVVFTVAACAIRFVPRRWRHPVAAALVGWVLLDVVRQSDMTSWGHALSVGIGLLSWHWIPSDAAEPGSGLPAADARPPVMRRRRRLLSAATIGCLAVLGAVAVGTNGVGPARAGSAGAGHHRADRAPHSPRAPGGTQTSPSAEQGLRGRCIVDGWDRRPSRGPACHGG
jgi:hypothetical protein